jgi:hypothetical protein
MKVKSTDFETKIAIVELTIEDIQYLRSGHLTDDTQIKLEALENLLS